MLLFFMPVSREIEEMLRDFLKREEDDPLRKRLDDVAKRQQNQADWQQEHETKDASRHVELLRKFDAHDYRITNLEKQAGKLEEEVEDTKTHDLRKLRERDRRVSDTLWKVAVVVLMTLLGGGVVEFIHRVAGH